MKFPYLRYVIRHAPTAFVYRPVIPIDLAGPAGEIDFYAHQPQRPGDRDPFLEAEMRAIAVLLLVGTILLVMVVALAGGFAWLFEFRVRLRITNLSGKACAVTSANTLQTTRIGKRETVDVPHGAGDITIKQRNGKTWLYKNVLPLECDGDYKMIRDYPIPFGGAKCTVSYLLGRDGLLYLVLPRVKDIGVAKQKQPNGFPLIPDEETKTRNSAKFGTP